MKTFYPIIKSCPLFHGVAENDIGTMLTCLHAKEQKINKDEILFSAGDRLNSIGIVLSGSIYIMQEDFWGKRTILTVIKPGELFGEAFACTDAETLPVTVQAHEEGSVLFIDCQKILSICAESCTFHRVLIQNLIQILANKNIFLTRKMEHITKKTIREKVLSYLSQCAVSAGRDTFEIPFNRQELADYLSVDRSALSNTLCHMREEGLITFHKNRFHMIP